jgi:triosephosphate isomerase
MQPIYCCGEQLAEREAGQYFETVKQQIQEDLFHLNAVQIKSCIIAYEPVWAIGTGKTATSEQAQKMHAFIRSLIAQKYGQAVADDMTILYGGSCNAQNAAELFANPDVDGGLIGGASLKSRDFTEIVKACN